MNILLHTYLVSPIRGSEASVAWNYIINISKNNHIYVLCGTSGDFFGDFKDLDDYLDAHILQNVTFLKIYPNKKTILLNYLNKKHIFKYSFYFAYKNWEKQVYNYVLAMPYKYDIIHFLGPIGFREPGYLWKINKPYIWGPIGGTVHYKYQAIDNKKYFTISFFKFRDMISDLQLKYSNRVKKALKKADIIIAANSEEKKRLEQQTDKKIDILPENGISDFECFSQNVKGENYLNLIQIGEISSGKNVKLLLDSLLLMKNKDNIRLKIIGSGKEENYLKNYVKKNNLNSIVEFFGRVNRQTVFSLLKSSDLHILTSLKEAASTVLLEAMSVGIPTLSLNHCGMGDIICEKCGILIDITTYKTIKQQIALCLDNCINNPGIINTLRTNLLICRKDVSWSRRRDIFNAYYLKSMDIYTNKQDRKSIIYQLSK
jgi:glycosyltransferase involved in cell wall biosynthesis